VTLTGTPSDSRTVCMLLAPISTHTVTFADTLTSSLFVFDIYK
jgi:hypothetical protein